MTVNEFIEWCNQAGLTGDEKIRVSAMGGMRTGKDIKSAAKGFDWDNGAVVLFPEQALCLMESKQKGK